MVTGNTLSSEKLLAVAEDLYLLSPKRLWKCGGRISSVLLVTLAESWIQLSSANVTTQRLPKFEIMLFNLNKMEIIYRMETNLF